MERRINILCISRKTDEYQALAKEMDTTTFAIEFCDERTAIPLLDSFFPDIVFCDFEIVEQSGKQFFSDIRKRIPQIIINIILSDNRKEAIFKGMSFGINNFVLSPLSDEDCCNYLSLYKQILNRRKRITLPNTITASKTYSFSADNTISNIPSLAAELLKDLNPVFAPYKTDLRIGLEELLINAIEHGNLEISFEDKAKAIDSDTFEQLVESKKNNAVLNNRKVQATYHQEPEFDEWIITDEGNGFNPCEIPTFTKQSDVCRLHGRGILICHFQFDEIEYSNEGRTVRVRRYVPKFN